MSIIYDALKKVEQRLPFPNAKKETKNILLWLAIGAITLGFLASGFALFLLFSSLSKPVQITQKSSAVNPALRIKTAPAKPAPAPTLAREINPTRQKIYDTLDLKGIMDMEGERIALINNEILKAGDYINGAKVTRISKNTVELLFKDKVIILKIK